MLPTAMYFIMKAASAGWYKGKQDIENYEGNYYGEEQKETEEK